MAQIQRYVPRLSYASEAFTPFEDAQEAWFWFIQSQQARLDGARFSSGQGGLPRPCEPLDILKAVDRLYRQRRLLRDHLLVLRHYGRRLMPPDPRRQSESRAFKVWGEALERLEIPLLRKGIIKTRHSFLPSAAFFAAPDVSRMEVAAP